MKPITIAIAGLGSRGRWTYAECARKYPQEMKITAVADIVPEKVEEAARTFHLTPDQCYSSAEDMLKQDKLADVMFICTQDRQHYGHAIPALRRGYHLLLEKPVSPDLAECREIAAVAKEMDRRVAVCHVLRYTPFFEKIREVIASGEIGDVVSIQALENVAYWHQAHSFVRGNWRKSGLSSPMILQKACHDMDYLLWLSGLHCQAVSSYGSLTLFRADRAPADAGERCLSGCPAKDACPYDAEKIYITGENGVRGGNTGWPCDVLTLHPTEESVREALLTGPYGRCVYRCDNDVVDHQVVNLLLEGGATASFTMCAFTSRSGRRLKVMGALGDIDADMDANTIDICRFGEDHKIIDVRTLADDFSGHGGGDSRLLLDFIRLARDGESNAQALTSIDRSLESHYVAMAAEQSRLQNGVSIRIEDLV